MALICFSFDYPPIPVRHFDWSAVRDNYDEGSRAGHGANKIDALADLLLQEDEDVDQVGWLIEAPGINYLGTRKLGGWEFYWTKDHMRGLRFHSKEQADGAMMAIRELDENLFGFAETLGEAKPVEHAWYDRMRQQGRVSDAHSLGKS